MKNDSKILNPVSLMTKIILLFLLIFGFQLSQAQVFIGPRLGTSMSSTSSGTQYKESVKMGLHGGIVSNFWLNYKWQIQAEVLYNEKGYNHVICQNSYDRLTTSYVELPLMVRYRAWPISTNFIMNIGAGFYGSYMLSAAYRTDLGDGEIIQSINVNEVDRFGDMGFNFDISFERQVGNGKLLIETRLQPGITNLNFGSSEIQSNRHFSAMLSLNYLFAL
jgi:hypothetical protein